MQFFASTFFPFTTEPAELYFTVLNFPVSYWNRHGYRILNGAGALRISSRARNARYFLATFYKEGITEEYLTFRVYSMKRTRFFRGTLRSDGELRWGGAIGLGGAQSQCPTPVAAPTGINNQPFNIPSCTVSIKQSLVL